MSSITLKNFPKRLHTVYKHQAQRNSRSLTAEIFAALEKQADLVDDENALTIEQVGGCLKSKLNYVPTDEQMKDAVDQMFREKWRR